MRRRYKTARNKIKGRSGSERLEIKGFSKQLLTEMDYFLSFNENKEDQKCFHQKKSMKLDEAEEEYEDSIKSLNSLTAADQKYFHREKRLRLDETEDEYKEPIKSLNRLTAAVLQASTLKRDPFFLALEDEFAFVPANRKSALKLKLMTLIIENHE